MLEPAANGMLARNPEHPLRRTVPAADRFGPIEKDDCLGRALEDAVENARLRGDPIGRSGNVTHMSPAFGEKQPLGNAMCPLSQRVQGRL
jgi:hypothetical protein